MKRKPTTHLANLLRSCIDKKAHRSGKILHAHTLRSGLFSDTFLSNRLIELYSKCNKTDSAYHVFAKMPQKDIYSWNAILCGFCKAGDLRGARKVFEEMPERNVVSWNNLISALVRSGYQDQALDVYDVMMSEGFMPSYVTYASVLSACGAVLDVEFGRKCHCLTIKIGLDTNAYVSNGLLNLYSKCGLIADAIQVFGSMDEPNEVSFTAMVGGLAQMDRVLEALELFKLMCKKGIQIDSVSLSSVLGVCARDGYGESDQNDSLLSNVHGQQIHGLSIKLGFERDVHLGNSLLDMYAKHGDMRSAEIIFSNLPELSVVSWNIMMDGYGQKCQSEKAIEYLRRMEHCGFEPDEVSYIHILAACVKSGDVATARQMFDSLSCPTLSSWNTILSGYSQHENHNEAIKLFREMQFQHVKPDRTTLAIILSSCAGMSLLEAGKQIHAASQKIALYPDTFVVSGLIGMYTKCGKTEMAERIFCRVPKLDIVCWNTMIAGFSQNSLNKEAFILFKQMLLKRMVPTQFSYATVLSCCAKLSSSSQGRQVHAHTEKDGYVTDVVVGSALINMYCKCGDVYEAWQFFNTMPVRNTVTWNEMIHGYAQNGHGNEALVLYQRMIEAGEKPDGITFTSILTGCSHSGMVDAGLEIFNSMQRDHGIGPELDHYTCIIDSLGRAGRFHEAEALMDKMPYKDDPIIWEVLLSSCRVHANVSLAKRAAEELFRLDPENSAPYVLLANIYSSLGRWDEVRAVRELMTDRQIVKDPGYSWTEDKDQDTRLYVG
ncbi:hypothetical protein SLA2020_424970 [Shorea laevis]